MSTPARPGSDLQSDLLARVAFLRDNLDMSGRFEFLGRLLVVMRDNLYPGIRILAKANGDLEITIARPEAGGR